MGKKKWNMGILPLHLQLGHLSSLTFGYQSSWFSGLQILGVIPMAPLPFPLPPPPFLGHWTWIISLGFLVLQCADSTSWHISVSTITWTSFHKTPLIDPYISYWVYFSGKLEYNSCLQCPNPVDKNAEFIHDARIKIWGPNQVCTDVSRLDGPNGACHWPLAVNPYMCVWSSRFLPLPHPHMLCWILLPLIFPCACPSLGYHYCSPKGIHFLQTYYLQLMVRESSA